MSQAFKDYYSILDLAFQATEAEIKTAYRKLAMELHPDKHPEETERYTTLFQEVTEAYETLSDPYKKGIYDLQYRQIVLHEGPQYEYVVDNTPPDTKTYKHKYTYRNRRTFSFASAGAAILLFFQVVRMLVNAAPMEDGRRYPSPIRHSSEQAAYPYEMYRPAPGALPDSLTRPYSNAPFMDNQQ